MKINGKETALKKPLELDILLEKYGFDFKKTAVMKNGNIVPKAEYKNTIICDDDNLEIVSFVGGG